MTSPVLVLLGHGCAGPCFSCLDGVQVGTCWDEQRGWRQEASGTCWALGPAPRGHRSRSSSAGNISTTSTNPSPRNAISVGLSGRPKGIWDINQVLICSTLVKIPTCAAAAVLGRAEPSSWGHCVAGTELPAPAQPSRAPHHLHSCHVLRLPAPPLHRESPFCVTKSRGLPSACTFHQFSFSVCS